MNPAKRKKELTVLLIQHLATTLQPNLNDTDIVDEWKAFQLDDDLPAYEPRKKQNFSGTKCLTFKDPMAITGTK